MSWVEMLFVLAVVVTGGLGMSWVEMLFVLAGIVTIAAVVLSMFLAINKVADFVLAMYIKLERKWNDRQGTR